MIRTYTELSKLKTFRERYEYLKLGGKVGEETFGVDRYLNQKFYRLDPEWKRVRDIVILRDTVGDYCCDLGLLGREIRTEKILVHHMNPVSIEDVVKRSEYLLNPEYLIATVLNTHNAIHYGDESLLMFEPVIRTKNDTCPWRK